jgi:hypothetical protein
MRKLTHEEKMDTVERLISSYSEVLEGMKTIKELDTNLLYEALRELSVLSIKLSCGSAPDAIRELTKEDESEPWNAADVDVH